MTYQIHPSSYISSNVKIGKDVKIGPFCNIDGKIEIRPMMYLALTYDHRVVDGKGAVTFLVRVKDALEDPRRLLIDL